MLLYVILACSLCRGVSPAAAAEAVPRTSDREIIQPLVELKSGQQTLQDRLSEGQKQIAELRQSTRRQVSDLRRICTDVFATSRPRCRSSSVCWC